MATDMQSLIQQKREEAARAAAEVKKYEMMEEMLNNAEMREILKEQLGVTRSEKSSTSPSSNASGGVGITKLKAVMQHRNNQPILITELAEAAGLSVSSVRQLMTKTQAFLKESLNSQRQGLYVLKDDQI